MEKLNPCPFCGGEAAQRDFTEPFVNGWVGCQKCHCFINWVKGGKPEAVAAWNRRVASKPLMLDGLRHMGEQPNPQWVWLEIMGAGDKHQSGYYRAQLDYTRGRAFCCGYPGQSYAWDYADYGKTWLAYGHKPEKE